jgi:hypothetical protein
LYHGRKLLSVLSVFLPDAFGGIPGRIDLFGDDLCGSLGSAPVIVADTDGKGVYDPLAWWEKVETELRQV